MIERFTKKYIVYPDTESGKTGTLALFVLSLIDFLRIESNPEINEVYGLELKKSISFLKSLMMENGQFHKYYNYEEGSGFGGASPYFDGEALLALIKAAKYATYDELQEIVLYSAESMFRQNVEKALKLNPDSPVTKGFYQWGSMAFFELFTSGWENVLVYGDRVLALSNWMIDIHKTLHRTKNTAYAYEGIVLAWETARILEKHEAAEKLLTVIETGLYKLLTWQIGSPVENEFLREHPTNDPKAIGGVLNKKDGTLLRIDITQHQMHAVILALRYIYTEKKRKM